MTHSRIGTEGVILAGGQASRLSRLRLEQLKPLVLLEGRPLLEWIIEWLTPVVTRVVVAVGTKRESIASSVAGDHYFFDDRELGTGHAVLSYAAQSSADQLLICNADTINDLDIVAFCAAHGGREYGATLALTRASNVQNRSAFSVTREGRILRSLEDLQPTGRKPRFAEWFGSSTGVLIAPTATLRCVRSYAVSLEEEIIPELIDSIGVFAYDNKSRLSLDIGTPDRLQMMKKYQPHLATIMTSNIKRARQSASKQIG